MKTESTSITFSNCNPVRFLKTSKIKNNPLIFKYILHLMLIVLFMTVCLANVQKVYEERRLSINSMMEIEKSNKNAVPYIYVLITVYYFTHLYMYVKKKKITAILKYCNTCIFPKNIFSHQSIFTLLCTKCTMYDFTRLIKSAGFLNSITICTCTNVYTANSYGKCLWFQ